MGGVSGCNPEELEMKKLLTLTLAAGLGGYLLGCANEEPATSGSTPKTTPPGAAGHQPPGGQPGATAPAGETPAAPAGETPAAPAGETPAAPAGENKAAETPAAETK